MKVETLEENATLRERGAEKEFCATAPSLWRDRGSAWRCFSQVSFGAGSAATPHACMRGRVFHVRRRTHASLLRRTCPPLTGIHDRSKSAESDAECFEMVGGNHNVVGRIGDTLRAAPPEDRSRSDAPTCLKTAAQPVRTWSTMNGTEP